MIVAIVVIVVVVVALVVVVVVVVVVVAIMVTVTTWRDGLSPRVRGIPTGRSHLGVKWGISLQTGFETPSNGKFPTGKMMIVSQPGQSTPKT